MISLGLESAKVKRESLLGDTLSLPEGWSHLGLEESRGASALHTTALGLTQSVEPKAAEQLEVQSTIATSGHYKKENCCFSILKHWLLRLKDE